MKIAIVEPASRASLLLISSHREDEIVVYEASDRVGGHSHTVEVESEAGGHWIDANGYDGAIRAMRTHVFDRTGYPGIPVTLAWGEHNRLVGPPRPERRPAGARFLTVPAVGHTPTWDDPDLVATTLLRGSAFPVAG